MTDVETLVIGAGVTGLASAAALAKNGHEVVILDSEQCIGQGVSARNSEVIHAGIYYPHGSLKAELCVQGREMLYQYCSDRGVACNRLGKLIVACDESDSRTLVKLLQKAKANGVSNIEMLSGADAMAMQPGLQCNSALHSADTGIVDSHALMQNLDADICNHGGTIVLQSEVSCIEHHNHHFTVTLTDNTFISAKHVINCCGLNAIALAQTCKALPKASIPEAKFAKGNYFRLTAKAPFNKLIYPAPVVGGLGIHLTIDLAGQKRFGPDVEWLPDNHSGTFDYSVNQSRSKDFYAAIRRYWPDLPDNTLVADYAGVRPKIFREGCAIVDFEISSQQHHNIDGLINLYGIESPGLTSALAIAERVKHLL